MSELRFVPPPFSQEEWDSYCDKHPEVDLGVRALFEGGRPEAMHEAKQLWGDEACLSSDEQQPLMAWRIGAMDATRVEGSHWSEVTSKLIARRLG